MRHCKGYYLCICYRNAPKVFEPHSDRPNSARVMSGTLVLFLTYLQRTLRDRCLFEDFWAKPWRGPNINVEARIIVKASFIRPACIMNLRSLFFHLRYHLD